MQKYWVLSHSREGCLQSSLLLPQWESLDRSILDRPCWKPQWRGLFMQVYGLGMQACVRACIRYLAGGWVLDCNSLQRLKCPGFALNLVWGSSFPTWRTPGEMFVNVYEWYWKITVFQSGTGFLIMKHWKRQNYRDRKLWDMRIDFTLFKS